MEMSPSGQGVDTVLSETGIQQCEAVGRYLKDTKFCNVFVSDLQRAMQVRWSGGYFTSLFSCSKSKVKEDGRWGMLSEMWQHDMLASVEEDPVDGYGTVFLLSSQKRTS